MQNLNPSRTLKLAALSLFVSFTSAQALAATATAEVSIDLRTVSSSSRLAEVIGSMSGAQVLDGNNGACNMRSFIQYSDTNTETMNVELAFNVTKEGRINCAKEANDWRKGVLNELRGIEGVTVVGN